jgi:hypothetical protein
MHAFSPLRTAQHVPRTLGLRCEWQKNKEEMEGCSCTYNHTSNLEAVLALGSGLVALWNDPNLDEISAKNKAICSRPAKREKKKKNESNISGVGGVKRICQLDHAERFGVLQGSIERRSELRIDRTAAAEIEVAQHQTGTYHHIHITY